MRKTCRTNEFCRCFYGQFHPLYEAAGYTPALSIFVTVFCLKTCQDCLGKCILKKIFFSIEQAEGKQTSSETLYYFVIAAAISQCASPPSKPKLQQHMEKKSREIEVLFLGFFFCFFFCISFFLSCTQSRLLLDPLCRQGCEWEELDS